MNTYAIIKLLDKWGDSMNLKFVDDLRCGNSLIHVGSNEEFVFYDSIGDNDYILIPKKDWRNRNLGDCPKIQVNIADMSFYDPNAKIEIIDGCYNKLLEAKELEELFIFENNNPIGTLRLLKYGSDDYHIRVVESSLALSGTFHTCQFGELLDRNNWKVVNFEGLQEWLKV